MDGCMDEGVAVWIEDGRVAVWMDGYRGLAKHTTTTNDWSVGIMLMPRPVTV